MSDARSEPTAAAAAAAAERRRRYGLTPVRVVVGVGLLAIAIAAVAILAQRAQRRSGTNLTADTGYVIPLGAGEQLCEPGELLPGDTGALRLSASSGASPGGRLRASVADAQGLTVSTGALAPGWRTGVVTIPISRIARTLPGALVCLLNEGARISLGGSVPDANFYVVLGGKPLSGRMRIEYMRPGRESWFALLGTLAYRFSLAKADLVRHWAVAAVIVLMLIAIVLTTRVILREEPS
ncbi:MAG TPA: hypothetical protein VH081_09005 [Solirubrobacteraceae bacterium]|nr:hypothetical protein [Solirubrobacteraceae bacterium]